MKIKITDVYPGVGGFGQGTTIKFELDDVPMRRESWFVESTSGTDYYDADDEVVRPFDNDPRADLLHEFLDEVEKEYAKAYEIHVLPALETAAFYAKGASEAMQDEPQFESIEVPW